MNRSDRVVARARFGVPHIPNASVRRSALIERLRAGAGQTVTIVAAAPGSGKTALLTQWVSDEAGPVAWLSCDADDADPASFWRDLCIAIQGAWSPFGTIDVGLLDELGTRELAVELANDLAAVDQPGLIVLDDFHLAGADPAIMSAFIAALPRNVRLVLGSRADPAFPVARLRVQGKLLELRQNDLRFTIDESRRLLAGLGVTLANDELEQLEAMTEGWAAAIQLAGLSLRARADGSALLRGMLTTDHSMIDFLVNEVIDTQPPEVQDFLMVTAELETFDVALCATAGGWPNSVELLDRVRAANLFLVERAGSAGTYRYHNLFGQFLRGRIQAVAPSRARAVHEAAADTYRQRLDPLAAVRHRMLVGDTDAAFDDLHDYLISSQSLDDRAVGLATARNLLAQFGMAQLTRSASKILDCVIVLNTIGVASDEAATWLGRVDARAAELDESTLFQLHGAWSFYHLHQGDPAAALNRARKAQDLQRTVQIDNEWRYVLPNLLVQAQQWLGDLDAAEEELRALRVPDLPPIATDVRAAGFAAYLQVLRGDLKRAETVAIETLNAADRLGLARGNFGRAEPELALALLEIEHNSLDAAQSHLDRVMQIAEGGRRPPFEFLAHLQHARLAALRGDEYGAAESLRLADRVFADPKPPVRAHLDQIAARIALDRDEVVTATAIWTRLPKAPAADLLEARIRLAEGQPLAAQSALARVVAIASRRTEVEHGLLSALALSHTDLHAAHDALETALLAAQPERFLMTIVGEGPQLWSLLESLPVRPDLANYVEWLLQTARQVVPPPRPVGSQGLVEPLSERELTVLRHLASRLGSTEIADVLFLSVNTVRSHVKAIYRKLGVNSRADAISRARALSLF